MAGTSCSGRRTTRDASVSGGGRDAHLRRRGADSPLAAPPEAPLNTLKGHLICVGSSATLGAGEDAKVDRWRYAETIFGEFDEGAGGDGDPEDAERSTEDPNISNFPIRQTSFTLQAEEFDLPGAARRRRPVSSQIERTRADIY